METQSKNRLNRVPGPGNAWARNYIAEGALIRAVLNSGDGAAARAAAGKEAKPCGWTICRKAATSKIDATTAVSAAAAAEGSACRSAAADSASVRSSRSA